jgi:ketosteroid isomerase-like protein
MFFAVQHVHADEDMAPNRRNRLRVEVTPPGGPTVVRSGYTLTVLRKESDGRWVIARDANLLAVDES